MNKIKYLLFTFAILFLVEVTKINAFSINASNSVYKGSSIAVKIEASGLIGRFDITSSNENVLAGSDTKWIEDGTITMYFTAKSTGKATITVRAVDVADANGNEFTGSRSLTINVVNKKNNSVDINKTYHSNNYLNALSVEGYEITPIFNKDTLEYSMEVDSTVESINVVASKADSTARVTGAGEINLTDGINKVEIVVTAENGNTRTYIINVTVKELNPIFVNIDDKEYTIVKKRSSLPIPENYTETTVTIENTEIPAFYSDITRLTLIGLKDSGGNIHLYIYDVTTGHYKSYTNVSFTKIPLLILEVDDQYVPDDYTKEIIELESQTITAYKRNSSDDYYLIYGMNIDTGTQGFYTYDKQENTIQRYDASFIDDLTHTNQKYLITIFVLGITSVILLVFLIQVFRRARRLVNS